MIQLLAYYNSDGSWTMPDEAIFDAYNRTIEQGSIKSVFWDGKIQSKEDFINYFKSPRNIPVFVFKDGEPCGYAWINNIGSNHACSHFCYFKKFWGEEKKDIFETVINYWFSFMDGDSPLFETLIGMIPKFNQHAIHHVLENGFKLVGEIPNMVNDVFQNRKSPIVIFYRNRHG